MLNAPDIGSAEHIKQIAGRVHAFWDRCFSGAYHGALVLEMKSGEQIMAHGLAPEWTTPSGEGPKCFFSVVDKKPLGVPYEPFILYRCGDLLALFIYIDSSTQPTGYPFTLSDVMNGDEFRMDVMRNFINGLPQTAYRRHCKVIRNDDGSYAFQILDAILRV
jgi:hypothetical protein